MSDIHYIKIKARNIEILTQGKMTPSKRNNAGFPSGTGALDYMEMPTLSA